MVSFHTSQIPTERNNVMEDFLMSKKRKWEGEFSCDEIKPQKAKNMTTLFGIQLNPETPLPLEWQRCLDIKSGQIYFYNTRTQKKTSNDPRQIDPEPPTTHQVHMSLDLELNLLPSCGSPEKINPIDDNNIVSNSNNYFIKKNKTTNETQSLINRSPSWLTFDVDQQEMITAVCKKCHMLVMMSKSSPTCPNCKFVHPLGETPTSLFKKRLSSF